MNFKTHNDTTIDINGTSLQGEVTATYAELCDLFGGHHDGDGYKVDAEWYVQFADGTIATIYNWKNGKNYCGESGQPLEQIDNWHIGGNSPQAETLVQIAIDLRREKKQEEASKGDKVQEAFGSVFAMFESMRANKGEGFAKVVEVALYVRKRQELTAQIVGSAVEAEAIPPEAANALQEVDAMLAAKIIATAASLASLGTKKEMAEEVMNWVERIMDAEQISAKKLFGELMEKRGD